VVKQRDEGEGVRMTWFVGLLWEICDHLVSLSLSISRILGVGGLKKIYLDWTCRQVPFLKARI
jgi:hypothetical protein